jgi:hypothetical protein
MKGLFPEDIDVPGREVPPKLPTRIKIKLRERVIVGLTALLAVAAGLAPLATMARVGLVTFIACAGLMLALGRVPGTGAPFEAYFVVRINFWMRPRFYVKGGTSTRKEYQIKLDPESWGSWRLNVRALPLSWWGWLGVLLIVIAAVIITGLWTGEL